MINIFTSCAIWLRMLSCISSVGVALPLDMPRIPLPSLRPCKFVVLPFGLMSSLDYCRRYLRDFLFFFCFFERPPAGDFLYLKESHQRSKPGVRDRSVTIRLSRGSRPLASVRAFPRTPEDEETSRPIGRTERGAGKETKPPQGLFPPHAERAVRPAMGRARGLTESIRPSGTPW